MMCFGDHLQLYKAPHNTSFFFGLSKHYIWNNNPDFAMLFPPNVRTQSVVVISGFWSFEMFTMVILTLHCCVVLCWFWLSEYGFMMKITEKSDVYSYGVVVLEVLTGKQPIDPTIPDGLHIVDWVRQRRGGIEVLNPSLREARPESEIEEMMQTLGVALLCVNPTPDDRPTMKDVAAMLKEIRLEREECLKIDKLLKGSPATDRQENSTTSSTGGSSAMVKHSYLQSNNTSFSASSLLYSSSSNA